MEAYHCSLATTQVPQSSTIRYPISDYLPYASYTSTQQSFALAHSCTIEPRSYQEAILHDCWKEAIQVELDALARQNTWTLSELLIRKKVVGCRWFLKIKHNADGSTKRYKARLVDKGFTQIEGLDYLDTFNPVARMTTVRVLLAIATAKQ